MAINNCRRRNVEYEVTYTALTAGTEVKIPYTEPAERTVLLIKTNSSTNPTITISAGDSETFGGLGDFTKELTKGKEYAFVLDTAYYLKKDGTISLKSTQPDSYAVIHTC